MDDAEPSTATPARRSVFDGLERPLGICLLVGHAFAEAALAIDLGDWLILVYAYLIVGDRIERFERWAAAIGHIVGGRRSRDD